VDENQHAGRQSRQRQRPTVDTVEQDFTHDQSLRTPPQYRSSMCALEGKLTAYVVDRAMPTSTVT
jgi:hypothetical protein